MTSPALESWLRQRFRSEAVMGILVALAALALGLVVMASPGAVPPEILAGSLRAGHEWRDVELQLKLVEGVVFLSRGLSLTAELRSDLNQHVHAPA